MIESLAMAIARDIRDARAGVAPDTEATWNAVCLTITRDLGFALVTPPQIPPRNGTSAGTGK